MHYHHYLLWGLLVKLSFLPAIANAQLIPDNTLGKENSVVNSVNSLQKQIDGGAIRGSNLFHSFKKFNIGGSNSVYFSNPSAIENILTRVTGKNSSNIFGKLGVLGNANLFLINPNGIIFGENASLDISGSFTATTSPSIWFDNGFEFSATNPQEVPLLKVNLTPGLQLGSSQQADITNQGNLTVGEDLNLVSKNLNLSGSLEAGRNLKLEARDNLEIRDSANKPFIANAGNDLLLQGNQVVDIFALNNSDSGLFSGKDLILRSANAVLGDARYFSGGSFKIEQLDGSLGSLESPNDPIIRASGDVSFDSYTGASLHILARGSVNISGDVTITGADDANGLEETVILSNGESLDIDGKTEATLDIRAGTTGFGTPGITGSGSFTPTNPNTAASATSSDIFIGGNIRVDAADGLVFLSNQYQPNNNLSGGNIQIAGNIDTSSTNGNGGRIFIDSSSNINPGGIDASSSFGRGGTISLAALQNITISGNSINTSGNQGSGDINITTGSLEMNNGAQLSASTFGEGNAGSVNITATNDVKFDGGGAFSQVNSGSVGNAGGISITTGTLEVTNGAKLASNTFGRGNAGSVDITANLVLFDQGMGEGGAFSRVQPGAVGNAPGISITTQSLYVNSRSQLSTSTFGEGNAGRITINADSIFLSLSGVFSQVISGAVGDAGGISITTDILEVNNAQIATSLEGEGDAGRVNITASDYAKFDGKIFTGNAGVFSRVKSGGVGNAGGISITTGSLSVTNDAQLNASTNGKGDAGSITINASDSVEFAGNSGLLVQANNGEIAGSARVTTNQLSVTDGSQINVSSPLGQAGNLEITADNLFLNQGILTAETGVGEDSEGANITLNIKDLLWMQNQSLISAEAFNTANGGNITINNSQGFVIGLPFENSDIIANATQGNGGKIDITTQNIFGLVFREQRTNKSDITASSQFGVNGRVIINQLNVNPASDLVELPSNFVVTTGIKAGCIASQGNNFVISGRGGLPESPNDLFHANTIITELFDLIPTEQATSNIRNRNPIENQKNQIIEATGWVKDADDNVIFVAKSPEINHHKSRLSQVDCEDFPAVN